MVVTIKKMQLAHFSHIHVSALYRLQSLELYRQQNAELEHAFF